MATRAVASAVFPLPIEKVWAELRDFTFPKKYISEVSSCVIEDAKSPEAVGCVRTMKWKSGGSRKDKLLELSDQYRKITWEMVESDPIAEASASISSLRLYRVTEQNHTLVEWSCDYSADCPKDYVAFNQKAFLENLKEIRKNMSS